MTPTPKDQHADDKAFYAGQKVVIELTETNARQLNEEQRMFAGRCFPDGDYIVPLEQALSSQQCQPREVKGNCATTNDVRAECLAAMPVLSLPNEVAFWLAKYRPIIKDALEQRETIPQPSNTPPLDALEIFREMVTRYEMTGAFDDEEINAVFRAISQKPVDAWQPIETAPKCGRRIFLASFGGGKWYGFWDGKEWRKEFRHEEKTSEKEPDVWFDVSMMPPTPSQHPDKER